MVGLRQGNTVPGAGHSVASAQRCRPGSPAGWQLVAAAGGRPQVGPAQVHRQRSTVRPLPSSPMVPPKDSGAASAPVQYTFIGPRQGTPKQDHALSLISDNNPAHRDMQLQVSTPANDSRTAAGKWLTGGAGMRRGTRGGSPAVAAAAPRGVPAGRPAPCWIQGFRTARRSQFNGLKQHGRGCRLQYDQWQAA